MPLKSEFELICHLCERETFAKYKKQSNRVLGVTEFVRKPSLCTVKVHVGLVAVDRCALVLACVL